MINQIKIGTKFFVLVSILLLILFVVSGFAVLSLNGAHYQMDTSLKQAQRYTQAISLARSAQVEFKIQVQEWKNILLRGHDTKDFIKYQDGFTAQEARVQEELTQLKGVMQGLSLDTNDLEHTILLHKELGKKYKAVLENYDSANPVSPRLADLKVKGIDRAPTEAIDNIVKEIEQTAARKVIEADKVAEAQFKQTLLEFMLVLLAGTGLAVTLAFLFTRQIVRPVHRLREELQTLAENGGDLTQEIDIQTRDEIGDLARAVNSFLANLRSMMQDIQQNSHSVNDTAEQLHANAQQISVGANETAATMSEISSTVEQVATNMQEIARVSSITAQHALESQKGLTQINSQMNNIVYSTASSSQVIHGLSEKSVAISRIVELINTIAEQTNLLALNAAIEAARAGDQGRGFAVVAEEVRKLAERSATAAQDIRGLIGEVQSETSLAVQSMDQGSKEVADGRAIVEEVGTALQQIIAAVKGLTDQIHDVVSAAQQMSAGVQNVAATAEEQTASMEEVAASVQALSSLANQTNTLVDKFKI